MVLPELLYALKHGRRNESKDYFDPAYDTWNFAVEGTTKDQEKLRVIVNFDEENLLIITVIDL